MNMVKLMLDTCHRAVRVRLVQGLIATAVIVAASVAPAAADKMDDSPDLVLYDGKISTVDANNSTVEAIAIRDGTIIARGGSRQVRALAISPFVSQKLRMFVWTSSPPGQRPLPPMRRRPPRSRQADGSGRHPAAGT